MPTIPELPEYKVCKGQLDFVVNTFDILEIPHGFNKEAKGTAGPFRSSYNTDIYAVKKKDKNSPYSQQDVNNVAEKN